MKKSIRIFIAFLRLLVGLVFELNGMANPRKGGDENATEKLLTAAQYGALQAAEAALRG